MRLSSPPIEDVPVLGTISLLSRETQKALQTYPMTAERLTIGRDYDCDIRIYAPDVSKTHAVIDFDADTGVAALSVLGSNGLIHQPSNSQPSSHKPPAVIVLGDGDKLMVRKKHFQFNYGDIETQSPIYATPGPKRATAPVTPGPGVTPRRRNQWRMSIVGEGKRFIPTPAKPKGLGLNGTTPAKAKEEESDNVQLEFDELMDVVRGDGGETIYIEKKAEESEDDEPAPKGNPFMTPQMKRNVEIRNTSAVPRTRKLEQPPAEEDEETDAPPAVNAPRSVPLPSEVPATPGPAPLVPARVAYSTPRGSNSLRKSLLVHSARKVWEKERLKTVDGSIEAGHIETHRRRRSSSFGPRKTPRKSLPMPESESSSDDDVNQDLAEDNELVEGSSDKENAPSLQWVYEDGQGGSSMLEDSDSDRESLDADMSIPGAAVIDFRSMTPEQEISDSDEEYSAGEDMGVDGEVDEYSDEEHQAEVVYSSVEEEGSESEEEISEEINPAMIPLPETPAPPLNTRFYTPQPKRNNLDGPRMSLANFGGPAMRFTPGHAGEPRESTPEDDGDDFEIEYTTPAKLKPFTTPRKAGAKAGGLTPAQREKLGTPRRLPEPPSSGFREPVKQATFSLLATPTHRALLSPPSLPPADAPKTPMDDVKRRLGALRLKSTASAKKRQAGERRATVGFALPETPSRTPSRPSVPHTVGINRRFGAGTAVESIEEGDTESLPPKPTGQPTSNEAPLMLAGDALDEEDEEMDVDEEVHAVEEPQERFEVEVPVQSVRRTRTSVSTPTFTGVREMLKTPKVPKTPAFDGLRTMLKSPKHAPTPNLAGVRDLLREPRPEPKTPSLVGVRSMFQENTVPPTPSFVGIRDMYRQDTVPVTPNMVGMREMFAQRVPPKTPAMNLGEIYPEEESEGDEDEGEEIEPTHQEAEAQEPQEPQASSIPVEQPTPEPSPAKRGTRSRLPTRSTRPAARASQKPAAKSEPTRRTRTAAAPVDPSSEPVKRATRGKSATADSEADKAPSAASRRTRSRTVEPAPELKPEPEDEAQEAPASTSTSTRRRQILGEAETVDVPAPKTTRRKAIPKAASTSKPATKTSAKAKDSKAETAAKRRGKENTATAAEPEEPKRRKEVPVAEPVRSTRSTRARK